MTLRPQDGTAAASNASIDSLVAALARAVHAFVTYPSKSPARDDVVHTVQQALRDCGDGCVVLQVTNDGLRYYGRNLDASGSIERGLVLLLRRAFVAAVQLDTAASTRDIGQICELLATPETLLARTQEFSEILKHRGVSTIQVHVIASLQTIEAGAIPVDRLELVAKSREQHQFDPSETEAAEGGWVRVDPSVSLGRLSLSELPLVLPDAARVAVALRQLNGRRRESMLPEQALATHFHHVSALYESAEPGLKDTLYTQLAEAVSNLPEQLKSDLLQDELLPALVDGNPISKVIGYLPDEEIADALPSLLELGVGGVEMLSMGLSNLKLPPERNTRLIELLNDRIESRNEDVAADNAEIDGSPERTDALLTLTADGGHEFAPLSQFDLSVNAKAAARLEELVQHVDATDVESLRCHTDLVGLSANPSVVTGILRRSRGLFIDLESRGCLNTLADAVTRYAAIANGSVETTDEIAFIVQRFLSDQITPEFVRRVAMHEDPEAVQSLTQILAALGDEGADLIVATLQSESDRSIRRQLLTATKDSVGSISSGLCDHLHNPNWFVVRNVLALLGNAGPGFESSIASCLDHEDPRVIREAFLALARIGTRGALEITVRSLRHDVSIVREHAAEAIWRFSPEMSHPAVCEVLKDQEWLLGNPEVGQLLIRASRRRRVQGLQDLVSGLERWRFALWDRRRMALGREAWKAGRKND